MTEQKKIYRDCITRMINQINNEHDLKQIFEIVHRKSLKKENDNE